jgi:predicted CXXCH cytochrome family protein
MKFENRHLTWAWLVVTILFFAFGTQSAMAAIGSIVGSKHDFSSTGNSGFAGPSNQVCIYCHAPHASTTETPLWNHASTATTFTLYSSSTLSATDMGQPGGVSKLCLSCHDGTVAIDNFGGTGANSLNKFGANSAANLGTSLANDHPIGFTYNAALVTADPGLADPVATAVTIGTGNTGTIATKMLFAGKMECASCHDVHNSVSGTAEESKLVRISTAGSALCIACHKK